MFSMLVNFPLRSRRVRYMGTDVSEPRKKVLTMALDSKREYSVP